jgi:KaiC/GvpD/RAD55 family RecA-like ATPase
MKTPQLLRFGIPSLDDLLGHDREKNGGMVFFDRHATNLCIVGADGTGKSVLALHLAAHYMADATRAVTESREISDPNRVPRVVYVSTDLTFPKAAQTWARFDLAQPYRRSLGVQPPGSQSYAYTKDSVPPDFITTLAHYKPIAGEKGLSDYLIEPTGYKVGFIDLAARTAGDDWGFVTRLAGALSGESKGWPNLLIVDAVEGLEMQTGERDSHGIERSRRSRVAQLLREAGDHCHVVMLVEQQSDLERQPEEFVADFVVKLRVNRERDYNRRTVEVVKARGQQHIRGQHPYTIRNGRGSTTFDQPNPDDVPVRHRIQWKEKPLHWDEATMGAFGLGILGIKGRKDGSVDVDCLDTSEHLSELERPTSGSLRRSPKCQGYFLVFKGLSHLARREQLESDLDAERLKKEAVEERDVVRFGIKYLDEMLNEGTTKGVPMGELIALLGSVGTHKRRLAYAFLAQALSSTERPGIAIILGHRDLRRSDALDQMVYYVSDDHRAVIEKRAENDRDKWQELWKREVRERLICRRLEIGEVGSAHFIHIIQMAVAEAQQRAKNLGIKGKPDIRLEINDWSVIMATHPALRDDPLLLPFLRRYLRNEGVTTLLVTGIEGNFKEPPADAPDRVLRRVARRQIFTWHTSFYGERRVAIAAFPAGTADAPALVRELRPRPDEPRAIEVDPTFDLYSAIEEGHPQRIPLEVRLYAQSEQADAHFDELETMLGELFVPLPGQPIIRRMQNKEYDVLLSSLLNSNARHDHTIVLQVDEFWAQSRAMSPFYPVTTYLGEPTNRAGKPQDFIDPYRVWQPTLDMKAAANTTDTRRGDFFTVRGYRQVNWWEEDPQNDRPDRVPHTMDFGFLMLRRSAWEHAIQVFEQEQVDEQNESVQPNQPKANRPRIREIYNALVPPGNCSTNGKKGETAGESEIRPNREVTWAEFICASFEVARLWAQRTGNRALPFDLDMPSPESFACLLLEVLGSEKFDRIVRSQGLTKAQEFAQSVHLRGNGPSSPDRPSLLEWLGSAESDIRESELKYGSDAMDFFASMFILSRAIGRDVVQADRGGFQFQTRHASPDAIAVRQWYSTSSRLEQAVPNDWVVGRLPGRFSTRGDWFLAIIRGSRSLRLGERALDILSSHRSMMGRLHLGIGLPVRGVSQRADDDLSRTAILNVTDNRTRNVPLSTILRDCGAVEDTAEGAVGPRDHAPFYWLWRSRLKNYDEQTRVWEKWICRMLVLFHEYGEGDQRAREYFGPDAWYTHYTELTRGMKSLDALGRIRVGGRSTRANPPLPEDFLTHYNSFISELRQATKAPLK